MQIKKLLFDISGLITGIEIDADPTTKEVKLMVKVLIRVWWSLSDEQKKRYRIQVSDMRERLSKIEIKDKDAEKIVDLQTDIDALEAVIVINLEENGDEE